MYKKTLLCISVRQPWAEMIIQNKKTIEIRKSRPSYRGILAIQAASYISTSEFTKANIDPKSIVLFQRKAIIGVVNLIEVINLNEKLWEEYRDKHLIPGKWRPEDHKYAWILEKPIRIKPINYPGLPRYFEINEETTKQILKDLDKR